MGKETSFVLPNGLRCVHIADKTAVEMAGVFVNAGSRNDPDEHPGLAHFVEHTIFKGTARRSSWHINNRMERIGGELNAFTTKEETFLYAVGPRGCASRAIELVADLVINPAFPTREIEIERGVVLDEIDTYLDLPADAVYDDFEDYLFRGSTLGHNILGTHASVAALSSRECDSFIEQNYTPQGMVFFYSGPAPAQRVENLALKHFGALSRPYHPRREETVPLHAPFTEERRIDSHQANTVVGIRIPARTSPDRIPLILLANILGGPGMNALLNLELRERRGLVYSVDASTTFYSDCGMLAIAFGCDPSNRERCMELVNRTLSEILPRHLTPRRIEAAKKQFIGQTLLRNDNRDTRTFTAARSMLYLNHIDPITAFIDRIRSIDVATLERITAEYLNPEHLSRLTLL